MDNTDELVADLFLKMTNLPPRDGEIVKRFEALRQAAKIMGEVTLRLCPNTRERSLAITNLEQALMWAIGSIARNQDMIPTEDQ